MASLKQRLEMLEDRAAATQRDDGSRDWSRELFDAFEAGGYHWRRPRVKSTLPPFDLVEQPAPLDMLAQRIKAGTTTEADRLFLSTLPVREGTPEEAVEMVASFDTFPSEELEKELMEFERQDRAERKMRNGHT